MICYQEDFFSPGILPALANNKNFNLENFLKIRLNLALRLVKTHLFTNLVLFWLVGKLDNLEIAFHFTIKEKFSFLTILFRIILLTSC